MEHLKGFINTNNKSGCVCTKMGYLFNQKLSNRECEYLLKSLDIESYRMEERDGVVFGIANLSVY